MGLKINLTQDRCLLIVNKIKNQKKTPELTTFQQVTQV